MNKMNNGFKNGNERLNQIDMLGVSERPNALQFY